MTNIKTVKEVARSSARVESTEDLIEIITTDRATTLTALCEALETKSTNSLVGYEAERGQVEMRLTKIIALDDAKAIARTTLTQNSNRE